MLIRVANMGDMENLRRLYSELEIDAVKYQPEHFVVGYRNDDFFNSIFESSNQDILVAEIDGTVVGFSHVMILRQKNITCLKPQTAVYIQDMDVLECERSKWIWTLLIDAAKEYGKKRGADFINCVAWRKQAETIAKFFDKGNLIGIEGRLQTGSYDDKDGNKRYTMDVALDNFEFVEGKNKSQGDASMPFSEPSPYDYQDNSVSVENDPFAEYGDSVSIDDNFLD